MKINLYTTTLIFMLSCCLCHSQPGTWTWIKGSSTVNNPGNYGVMGVPAPTNEPPSKYSAAFWTDTAGNLWLYGGMSDYGAFTFMTDLWMFNPSTQMWTWVNGSQTTGIGSTIVGAQGVFNAGNQPLSLGWGVFTWTTPDNHLWFYGGSGGGATSGEFWQYDPAINQWAWMGTFATQSYGTMGVQSPTNSPGPRYECNASWQDSLGNLWLFGGYDINYNIANDLWRYNISAGQWTWMSGTTTGNDSVGVYGTMGVPSTNNYPPSRQNNFFWTDDNYNFWMTGGEYHPVGEGLQDVWRYNPQTAEWTWVAGPAHRDDNPPTGFSCDTDATNLEGKRYENRAVWKICDNLLLNFGGYVYSQNGYQQPLNQLWALAPSSGQWILLNESTLGGSYGTQGVSNFTNYPPQRCGTASFKDKSNNIWVFGGNVPSNLSYYNDLWEYIIDTTCIIGYTCAPQSVQALQVNATIMGAGCNGNCTGSATVNINQGSPPFSYLWSVGNTTASVSNLCPGVYTVTVSGASGTSATDSVTISASNSPQISVNANTISCYGDSASVTVSATGGTAPYTGTGTYLEPAGTYFFTVSDSTGCAASDTVVLSQPPPLQVQATADTNTICASDSAQVCATSGFVTYYWNIGNTTNCIEVNESGNYYVTVTDVNHCSAMSNQVSINVFQQPPVSISVNGDTLSAYNANSYQWYLNGQPIAGATSSTYIALVGGNYQVQVTDSNGCKASSNPLLVNGIENIAGDKIDIYPNPSYGGDWQLDVSEGLIGSKIEIYDADGRLVYTAEVRNLKTLVSLNVSSGIYLFMLHSNRINAVRKLVKL